MKPTTRNRLLSVFGIVFLLLVAVRAALPQFLLGQLNEKLAKLEGPFCAHMNDFDLALLRGRYFIQELSVSRWKPDRSACEGEVLRVESLDVGLSWGQLLKGRARLNVEARAPEVAYDEMQAAVKAHKKGDSQRDAAKQAKDAADVLIPWRIDSLALSGGRIKLRLLGSGQEAVTLDHAEGMISGIENSRRTSTPTLFRLKANIMQSARLLVTGAVNMGGDKPSWDVDYGVERVALTQANPLLLERAPITFNHGLMDVFGEAAGLGTRMQGYAKLVFREVDVVGGGETWKSFKHGLVEILGSLFFIVAKNPKRQTAGTIINFGTEEGEFKVDIAGTIRSALAHRSGERLVRPGIENRLSLDSFQPSARADASPERSL